MTYHTPANDSEGFTAALEAADNLAKSINKAINYPGVTVFPYRYVFVPKKSPVYCKFLMLGNSLSSYSVSARSVRRKLSITRTMKAGAGFT